MNKPTPEELTLLHDDVCSALNDKTRVAILFELAEGPRNVSSLVEALKLPQGTVSRHLKILRDREMVLANRDANRVLYEIQDFRILEVLNLLREILADSLSRRREAADRIRTARGRRGPALRKRVSGGRPQEEHR